MLLLVNFWRSSCGVPGVSFSFSIILVFHNDLLPTQSELFLHPCSGCKESWHITVPSYVRVCECLCLWNGHDNKIVCECLMPVHHVRNFWHQISLTINSLPAYNTSLKECFPFACMRSCDFLLESDFLCIPMFN